MSESIPIRVLQGEDAERFQALRLEALLAAPASFASSHAEEAGLSTERVAARLAPGPDAAVLGAFSDDRLLGTVGIFREARLKQRHKAFMWGVYVRPEARGRGLGRSLVDALLERAAAMPGVAQVNTSVYLGADAARSLYLRCGFVAWGREPGSARVDSTCLDEEHLVRRFEPAASPADAIRALEGSRLKALVERDMVRARELHAPDFRLVTPAGRSFTRDEYLGRIEQGVLRYLRWEPGLMEVRMGIDQAVVRYRATLEIDSGDGTGTPFQCWHIDSYERIGPAWQVVWSQATAIK